jgi:HAMP domain-containing protein
MSDADRILAELTEVRAQLDTLPDGDPARRGLEERRRALQSEARLLADSSRNPDYVRLELVNLERRLDEIERVRIKPSLVEHRKWINDPSAYAHGINRRIDENLGDEVEALEQRINELRQALGLPLREPSSRKDEKG